jgi:hypothetical protein
VSYKNEKEWAMMLLEKSWCLPNELGICLNV